MYQHSEKKKPPPFLHHYTPLDEHAADLIIKKRVFLSDPASFNDAFDCNAFLLRRGSARHVRAEMKAALRDTSSSAHTSVLVKRVLDERLYTREDYWDGLATGMQSKISRYGVYCFTERPDNFLLWSHYAAKHTGICLGFAVALLPEDLRRLVAVRYKWRRPRLSFFDKKNYHSIFSSKSRVWRCEREWRAIVPDHARQYVDFDGECLKAAILGCGCNERDVQRVIRWLQIAGMRPKLYWAAKHATRYRLLLRPVEYV